MVLSDNDIRAAIKSGKLRFEPKISDSQIGPASVDLTLDGKFWLFKKRFVGKNFSRKDFIDVFFEWTDSQVFTENASGRELFGK